MFGQPSYTFNIPENTDQLVGVGVSASDIDLGQNRDITYYISNGNQDFTFVLGRLGNQFLIGSICNAAAY